MEGSPSIADKLARLAELEHDFQRVLEAEKLAAMAEFAAGAGHEINNPLTVISGRAQLLLREETDPERQHALALISAQAMRVYEMIADMMLFARPPRPELQPVDLVKLVDDLIADFLPRGARKGTGPICRDQPSVGARPPGAAHKLDLSPFLPQETAICRTGDSGPIFIEADPAQINVALRAICQNSLEALGSGGHIEIAVERGSGAARIAIRDNGPGIKPEDRRHIFDPFYSARQAGRGLGLGLSKAWRIITNHGGRIDVDSQSGHGATFTVVLPEKMSGTRPQVVSDESPLPLGEG